jgi:ribonuclease P/MRP protein subunit RPP40
MTAPKAWTTTSRLPMTNLQISKSDKSIYTNADFFMGKPGARSALKFVETEKDLGVTFSSNLKFFAHVKTQANRASAILGQLKRTFRFWTIETCRNLYCAFVRPHLEYAAPAWSLTSKKDLRTLESVQRRATKLVPRLKNWSYEDRLAVKGLSSIRDRRVRGDFIQLFKLVNRATV